MRIRNCVLPDIPVAVTANMACNDVRMCDKRLKMYADIGVCPHR